MGLIKAILDSAGGALADQWLEFFTCDSMPADVLVTRGRKKTTKRSSNTKGDDNVISNGSRIAVAVGQCMMITDQGRIVELCAEPGEYTYDQSSEPSIFYGELGEGIRNAFRSMGNRFAFGGEAPKDQRVYYFNTKEILGNKFGTATPIMFRVVDSKIGLDFDLSLRVNGSYTFKIVDPLKFYTNVCGNVAEDFTRTSNGFDSQLRTEFVEALGEGLARLSELQLRPNQIPAHVTELKTGMNEILSQQWKDDRGIELVRISMSPPTLTEEDSERLKQAQQTGMLRDPSMGAATFLSAQADAMRGAANNPGGAMVGFAGLGMAMNQGMGAAAQLYAMGAQQQAQTPPAAQQAAAAGGWTCECGAQTSGKFCPNCGKPKPAPSGWKCSCGAVNTGKFCAECGKPKPAGEPLYKCDKCGWTPPDPKHPPKFCPECGDVFDERDAQ